MSTINLTGLTQLKELYLQNNQLTSITNLEAGQVDINLSGNTGFPCTALATLEARPKITLISPAHCNQSPSIPRITIPVAYVDLPYRFTLPAATDAEDDPLQYTLTQEGDTPLPAWLTFDALTRTLSGTPTALGTLSLQLIVTDTQGAATTKRFTLQIILRPAGLPTDVTLTDATHFPDAKLLACVQAEGGRYLETLHTIERLSCTNKGITDASGIERLTQLTTLNLWYNQLTEIDLTGLTQLTSLNLGGNPLKDLL